MSRITIGIPCYGEPPFETFQDYIRFAYYIGRRLPEHDFALAIKPKSEQYRARNAIIDAALQWGSDYILFLDDDQVIDWEDGGCYIPDQVNSRYGFVNTLIDHLKADPKRAIVGALYYHRGGDCFNVVMKEGLDGGFYYMRDDEIEGKLQEVAVQGGGCMLIDTNLFSVIPSPWFEAESVVNMGTDLQICTKARAHKRTVWCDTSIVLGHVMNKRDIVTPKNRQRIIGDSAGRESLTKGIDTTYTAHAAFTMYRSDVERYMGVDWDDILVMAEEYFHLHMPRFKDHKDPKEYYKSLGKHQLARQVWFHSHKEMREQMAIFIDLIDTSRTFDGLDFGCGSAPIGFDLVMRQHNMDFVDLDGASGYEFTKWRAKDRKVEDRCGWKLGGPYDYILCMDSIEHIEDWKEVLTDLVGRLKENGTIFTNYFLNTDFDNPEHISMDHGAVRRHLSDLGVFPVNQLSWVKRDLNFMMKKESAA